MIKRENERLNKENWLSGWVRACYSLIKKKCTLTMTERVRKGALEGVYRIRESEKVRAR